MSDSEDDFDSVNDSLQKIHQHVEQLAHVSKHMYARALNVYQNVEHPETDFWTQTLPIHDRARVWAKKNMVASKCSIWQIHETLLESAKKEGRITGGKVKLTVTEAEIMDLPEEAVIWTVLSRLPRFFL